MKTQLKIVTLITFVCTILVSCSSPESDAKKLAEMQCKMQKIMQKASSGDMTVINEGDALEKEIKTMEIELASKYTKEEDKKIIESILMNEMKNCK